MKEIEWRGFQGCEFEFEGLQAKLIKPNCKPNGKWLLKAEYFDAFPETEIELLNRGWHLAYNENYNRWAEDLDLKRKSKFLQYIPETFGLSEKGVLVGMSCGGLYSVKLTALNPERVQGIYLDAPVMNLLSCPCNLGKGSGVPFEEYIPTFNPKSFICSTSHLIPCGNVEKSPCILPFSSRKEDCQQSSILT